MSQPKIEAYPLQWPAGWKRSTSRISSSFKKLDSFGRIRDGLFAEVRRMGGTSAVLSTNIPVTKDNVPYAKFASPNDPGVAIYFQRKGKPVALACDKYRTVQENVRALQLTIDAMRGIERWGSSELMERSFTGFTALPAPPGMESSSWRSVLGFPELSTPTQAMVREKRNDLARQFHPDIGTAPSSEQSAAVNNAYEQAMEELA